MTQPSFRDVELLNAYLDDELDATQRQRLESRLSSDPGLKSIFDELREARVVLSRLPQRRAPRNFTLTSKMAGIKPPLPRAYPIFRFASAFAAILFFFTYAINFLPRVSLSLGAAAPMMETGIGGGAPEDTQRNQSGGGCDSCTAEATLMAEAPAAPSEKLPPAPMATAAPSEAEQSFVQPAPSITEPAADSYNRTLYFPSPWTGWQALLFIVACLAGGAALITRLAVERRWAKTNKISTGFSWRDALLLALTVLLILAALWGLFTLATGKPSLLSFSLPALSPGGMAVDSGDKGRVSPQGDKGGYQPAIFSLDPAMGYEYTYSDPQGKVIALSFPAGAYAVFTDLQFSAGQGAPTPPGYVYAGRGFQVYTIPDSLPLLIPVTVTLEYSDEDATLIPDENRLILMAWNGSEWIDAAALCSPASEIFRFPEENKVRMEICDIGGFALFAPAP